MMNIFVTKNNYMKIKLLILIFGFINFFSLCQDCCDEYYINEVIAGNDDKCYFPSGSPVRFCSCLNGIAINGTTFDVESWKGDFTQYLTLSINGGLAGSLTLYLKTNHIYLSLNGCEARTYSFSFNKNEYKQFLIEREKNLKQDKIIFSQVNDLISQNDYLNANIKLKSLKYPKDIDGIEEIKNKIQLKIYEFEKNKYIEIDSLAKNNKYEAAFIEYSKLTQPDSFNFNLSSWNWQNLVEEDLIKQYKSFEYKYRTDKLKKFIELYLGYKHPLDYTEEITKETIPRFEKVDKKKNKEIHSSYSDKQNLNIGEFIKTYKNYLLKLENGNHKVLIDPYGSIFIDNNLSDLPKHEFHSSNIGSCDQVMYKDERFNFRVIKCRIFDLEMKTLLTEENKLLSKSDYYSIFHFTHLDKINWELNPFYKDKFIYSKSFSIKNVQSGNEGINFFYSKWNPRFLNWNNEVFLDKKSGNNVKIDYSDSCPKNIVKAYFKVNKVKKVNDIELDEVID